MKYCSRAVALVFAVLLVPGAAGQQVETEIPETEKLAQTGFKFLSVSVDARAAAMASALTAEPNGNSASIFYNPASMGRLDQTLHVTAGKAQWIADVDYNMATLAYSPANGLYGVFGASLLSVGYGEYRATVRAGNTQGYLDYEDIGLKNPNPSALAVGFSYARALTDRFSVGGNVKYAQQSLGTSVLRQTESGYQSEEYDLSSVVFDLGVLYRTGFRSLNLAMSARNFSREVTYVSENFELPLTFRIGLSMDMMDLTTLDPSMHSLLLSVDAERPRDFSEQLKIGGEYQFMNFLALRAGYLFPTDEEGINLGVGLHPSLGDIAFGADYAYSTFGVFGDVHRITLQFGL